MPDPGPMVAHFADGSRLHLQHGPIDLIVECDGAAEQCSAARQAAIDRFDGLLEELVDELAFLRAPLEPGRQRRPVGATARRMVDAASPHARDEIVTPMVAVAGAVADEVAAAMASAAELDRWMVNNGGDIAFGLTTGQSYRIGLVVDPRRPEVESPAVVDACSRIRGVATSGRHGRSLSLGIADAVTVFAPTAADADAAATLIANAVDIGPHPAITRQIASDLDPDSDLGERMVTVGVGVLTTDEIHHALRNGLAYAKRFVERGHISGAVLYLAGTRTSTTTSPTLLS
jgi:ApbE superfamily uncharacterized protein (UPF0280 family)